MKNKTSLISLAFAPSLTLALFLGLGACSSAKVEHVNVESPEFKVMEAAPGGREAWLDNPQFYAEETKSLNATENFYYTGEAKSADKRLACEKAQANARDDIARQVATFVDTSLSRAAQESQTSDSSQNTAQSSVSEEVQRISGQLAKIALNGVHQRKQYWERRNYSETGGAKNLTYCWVLLEVSKKEVQSMIARATTLKVQASPELKGKVDDKTKSLSDEYEKFQKTH
jgi:hypothetical protein